MVRFHIIRNARIENVGKYQSCMLSNLRIIWKQTVVPTAPTVAVSTAGTGISSRRRGVESPSDGGGGGCCGLRYVDVSEPINWGGHLTPTLAGSVAGLFALPLYMSTW